jgi:hypothetical protein
MADLFDTLFPDPDLDLAFGRSADIHNFFAGVVDYVSGDTTRTQIINFLDLSGDQVTELDTLLAAVDALGTIQDKLSWLMQFQAVLLLIICSTLRTIGG